MVVYSFKTLFECGKIAYLQILPEQFLSANSNTVLHFNVLFYLNGHFFSLSKSYRLLHNVDLYTDLAVTMPFLFSSVFFYSLYLFSIW